MNAWMIWWWWWLFLLLLSERRSGIASHSLIDEAPPHARKRGTDHGGGIFGEEQVLVQIEGQDGLEPVEGEPGHEKRHMCR
jgi:hypothetical protein